MSRRRAHYTQAGDVTVIDAATRDPIARHRRYSPSELNAVRSGRNPQRVKRIAERKNRPSYRRNAAVQQYLEIINADN